MGARAAAAKEAPRRASATPCSIALREQASPALQVFYNAFMYFSVLPCSLLGR